MSPRPWMPFYLRDFRMATLGLEADELGVYLELIMLAWDSGDGSVTGDMKELRAVLQQLIAHFHGLRFNRIVPKILGRYFYQRDGRYYQKRVEKELRNAREMSENATRNINKRWADVRKSNAYPYHRNTTHTHTHTHIKKEEKEGVVRLREGGEFVEVESPEWEAWSKLNHWPQNDFKVDGRVRRGWWFPTRWPSSEFKPKLNGRSAPLAQEAG
jgi:uncharacterized protein YdaU (DUF1376 family)